MSHFQVTVIIANWNLKRSTAECIQSIGQLDVPTRILIVDNGSVDGSVSYLTDRFSEIELLALDENLGFGAACNLAIERALDDPACEFVFLLNNDAVIHPHALHQMLRVAESEPQVGILGPKIYDSRRRNILWYAGARCRPWVLASVDTGRGEVDCGQYDRRTDVDFVFGAAMLIRRSVIEDVGMFDPRFFLYLEDMDLCLRAKRYGYRIRFVPEAHVWHQGSASTASRCTFRRYHQARSTLLFLQKHMSFAYFMPVLVFWFLVAMRAVFLELWQGNTEVAYSYWLGFVHGLSEVRRP
jgi:GT2 family glycosyltransferase